MDFNSFEFHPQILTGIQHSGYKTPTPIQCGAIPVALSGRDLLGIAQTGTGKTAAFALPILQKLLTSGVRGSPRALIIAPTRELAEQIHENISILGRAARAKSVTVYGGVGMHPQIEKLRSGAEIIVACPGRLLDHINKGNINLSKIDTLVLDEADRMFDMGFLPDVRKIVGRLPKNRQNMFFSATMPDEIRRFADEILREPETVKIAQAMLADTVAHAFYPVEQAQKTNFLIKLLSETDTKSVLIFTKTKHRASRIAEKLLKEGHKATSLQGNLSQNRRLAAMNGFKNGTFKVLVATDIAARGIDVAHVSHVINYDMPNTVEDYTHRAGRTGRALRSGEAFSLITREDAGLIRSIERALNEKVQRRFLEGEIACDTSIDDRRPKVEATPRRNRIHPPAMNKRRQPAQGRAQA